MKNTSYLVPTVTARFYVTCAEEETSHEGTGADYQLKDLETDRLGIAPSNEGTSSGFQPQ
jgi:hypothetical protein